MTKQRSNCPYCGHDLTGQLDGRADWWKFRVRVYDQRRAGSSASDPVVDSNGPDADPGGDGIDKVRGLDRVMSELATGLHTFHDAGPLRGMSKDDLDKKVRGIRPRLSAAKGRATMRIEYDTTESFAEGKTPRFMARVDLVKEGAPDAATVESTDVASD